METLENTNGAVTKLTYGDGGTCTHVPPSGYAPENICLTCKPRRHTVERYAVAAKLAFTLLLSTSKLFAFNVVINFTAVMC